MKTSKTYIFFCLFGIVLIALVTVLVSRHYDPSGRTNLSAYVGGAAFLVYLAAIILYWFFKILVRGYGSPDQEKIGDVPPSGDLSVLKDWRTLFASMADPEDKAARGVIAAQKRRVVLSFALTSVMALLLVFGAIFLKWGETGALIPALAVVLPVWFFAQVAILITGRAGMDRLMKGLSLRPLADSNGTLPFLQTEVVYQGMRKGFAAYVAFGAEGTAVFVEKKDAQFDAGAKRWFGNLPRLEVWKDMKLDVGKDGIAIRRPRPGNFLWLYDLWLAENLASWEDRK